MKKLTISFCVLFLLMMSALPVSATPELYFGEVTTLEDGSKMVSLIVKDVKNLGSCDVNIDFSEFEGVKVTGVTSRDGNALTVQISDIDNTEGSVKVTAWDVSTAHSDTVVICNIAYEGSDSNPFEIDPTELFDYTTYEQIQHTENNDIDRGSGSSGKGAVAESTEIVDETNGSSGEDNNGIPGFGLLTGYRLC
ncbi:MAG: hypothetical protein ACT6FF_00785 [Methanosarcinaceae archaeon]